MTILTVRPRSNYSRNSNRILANLSQTVTDRQIIRVIDNHLRTVGHRHIITLLNTLRHTCTNYDGIYDRILGRGVADRYGREHHEVSALINECFITYIWTRLDAMNQELSETVDEQAATIADQAARIAELEARFAAMQAAATAALEGEGFEAVEDLILELTD